MPARGLARFLEHLQAEVGPDLLRLKGIVKCQDRPERPLVLHAVQHVVHEPLQLEAWPSADHDTRLVLIVRDMAAADVAKLFAVLTGEPGTVSR